MIGIQFDASLETGDATVDGQHRHIFAMFNDLYIASQEGEPEDVIARTMTDLLNYTANHFAAEQQLMARYAYPPEDVMVHVSDHTRLAGRVKELIEDHRSGAVTTVLPVAMLLQEWVAEHIRQHDRKFVAHLREYSDKAVGA